MLPIKLPPGPFPSRAVTRALGIQQSTIGTWRSRGVLDGFDYPEAGRGRTVLFSLVDALTVALWCQMWTRGVRVPGLKMAGCRQWVLTWLDQQTDQGKPLTIVIRYFGTPGGDEDRCVAVLTEKAELVFTGACVTIALHLDRIFLPFIRSLSKPRVTIGDDIAD